MIEDEKFYRPGEKTWLGESAGSDEIEIMSPPFCDFCNRRMSLLDSNVTGGEKVFHCWPCGKEKSLESVEPTSSRLNPFSAANSDLSGFPPGAVWVLDSRFRRTFYVRGFGLQPFPVYVEFKPGWWEAPVWTRRGRV